MKLYLHDVDAIAYDGRTGEPKPLRALTPEEWEDVRQWWERDFAEFYATKDCVGTESAKNHG